VQIDVEAKCAGGVEGDLEANRGLASLQLADDATIHPDDVGDVVLGDSKLTPAGAELGSEGGRVRRVHGTDR
jgi:hypothetical protein